jgi:hypothetical protein
LVGGLAGLFDACCKERFLVMVEIRSSAATIAPQRITANTKVSFIHQEDMLFIVV